MENLIPKKLDYSIVIVDLWKENSVFKLLEVMESELKEVEKRIIRSLNDGEQLIIYNKEGNTIN